MGHGHQRIGVVYSAIAIAHVIHKEEQDIRPIPARRTKKCAAKGEYGQSLVHRETHGIILQAVGQPMPDFSMDWK
jgi:hypothetical protein